MSSFQLSLSQAFYGWSQLVNRQLSNGLKLNRNRQKCRVVLTVKTVQCIQLIFTDFWLLIRGGTPLQEANGDVPLDGVDLSDFNGVALSIELLGWGRKFSDFWGK